MYRRHFLMAPAAALAARGAAAVSPAAQILGAALADEQGWRRLEHLCYRIGHRISGSDALEEAIAWSADRMREDGQENVKLQPVKVPRWVRGDESCVELAPDSRELRILGLGMSVGTPPGGVEGEVVAVRDFDELERIGRRGVEGKIVLYNAPYDGYGNTVKYRYSGASRAAKLGAIASLVRSVGSYTLSTPHTGGMRYSDDAPRIPAAAVTIEDAVRIGVLRREGVRVRLKLRMGAKLLPEADSANALGEIKGREAPEEIVVFGGHIDSWDVGQGAHDDGAACVAALQGLAVIRRLGLRPRRTLRVALWTNEENGGAGGRAYRDALGDDVDNHVAAVEMDGGCERPSGFGMGFSGERASDALQQARRIARPLQAIDAGSITEGGGGADIAPLMRAGVPGFGLRTAGGRYFEWHHTEADTLDKIDPADFRRAIATLAVFCYGLADMPSRLGEAA